ncbi:MAG: flap endonuclease [Actinomycetota bacterium]|nr:flap endonuclease [Actinomycetota bacterium]
MAVPVLLAVDGNSLVHRSFHAQARTGMHTADGHPTWAVRGLLAQLVAAVDRVRPSVVVVGFDDPEHSLRREQWPSYKANRSEKLDTLIAQLTSAVHVLRELGVAVVVPPALEADDVLASTAAFARRSGATTVIVTSDRDAFALIDDTTSVLRIINGGVEASPLMTADRLVTLLGVRPSQYREYAALRGDPSDNLPGVRGIGPRSAARLLCEFGTAGAAFDDLDAVGARLGTTIATRLRDPLARRTWELNCRVMAMRHDVAIDLDLDSGVGVLPLRPGPVEAVFRAQQLTWTVRDALRVFADVAPADIDEPQRVSQPWIDGWSGGSPRRLPKLAPRKPVPTQLSLFE